MRRRDAMTEEQQFLRRAPTASAVDAKPPAFKLYSTSQILWCSLVGGALAGTWMIRTNFKRLGDVKASHVASVVGAAVVGAVIVVSYLLERKFGRVGTSSLGIGLAIATQTLAKQYQGRAIAAHESAGGRIESVGKSLAVTALGLLQTLLGAAALLSWVQTTVIIGGTHTITLEGTAEKADAERLGAVLTDLGVFRPGIRMALALEREPSEWTVSFNLTNPIPKGADLAAAFTPVARELRARLFGVRFHLAFLDEYGLTKKRCELDSADALVCS
jgi:hypothetical protein